MKGAWLIQNRGRLHTKLVDYGYQENIEQGFSDYHEYVVVVHGKRKSDFKFEYAITVGLLYVAYVCADYKNKIHVMQASLFLFLISGHHDIKATVCKWHNRHGKSSLKCHVVEYAACIGDTACSAQSY